MTDPAAFNFGDQSVADSYDSVLVPVLFDPWAEHLVTHFNHWDGKTVLDLATGTGIVAAKLADRVGATGQVIAADMNGEMLEAARRRCSDANGRIAFVESPAHPLELEDASVDVIVCQQGYQFFPDRPAATKEMLRVLRPGGSVIVTTWCSVDECRMFGEICGILESMGEDEISTLMRIPFDHMSGEELQKNFAHEGFQDVSVSKVHKDFVIPEGIPAAVSLCYASPIGPKLVALSKARQAVFQEKLAESLTRLSEDGKTMGQMVSHVLSARKSPN